MSSERYTIVVQSVPGSDVPVINRLRRFLKMALRGYRLRCVEIRENTELVSLDPSTKLASKQDVESYRVLRKDKGTTF